MSVAISWANKSSWPNVTLWLVFEYPVTFHHYQTIPHQYLPTPAPLNTRSNYNQKLQHYQTRTNVYKFSFFPRTVPEWNDLTSNQVSALNLKQFKLLYYANLI